MVDSTHRLSLTWPFRLIKQKIFKTLYTGLKYYIGTKNRPSRQTSCADCKLSYMLQAIRPSRAWLCVFSGRQTLDNMMLRAFLIVQKISFFQTFSVLSEDVVLEMILMLFAKTIMIPHLVTKWLCKQDWSTQKKFLNYFCDILVEMPFALFCALDVDRSE